MSRLSHQADFNSRAGHPHKLYLPSQMTPIRIDDSPSPDMPHATLSSHVQDVFSVEQSNNPASSSRSYRYTSESPGSWNPNNSLNSLALQSPEYYTHHSHVSHTRPHVSPVSQPHLPQPRVSIESFDHNTLLGNALYRDLYFKNLSLEAKLEASQKAFETLANSFRGSGPSSPMIAGDSSGSFDGASTTFASATTGADPYHVSFSHPLLQPLQPSNFPNVHYWNKHSWMANGKGKNAITDVNHHAVPGKTRITQGQNVQYPFMEDKDGNVWTGYQVQSLTSMLREIFKEFERRDQAPSSWGYIPAGLNNFVRISCYTRFHDLQLCEGHWKLEYIACRTYSGWNGNKLPAPDAKDPKKESSKRGTATNDNGDYMHRPQKRAADVLSGQKSAKKFKVPKNTKPINAKSTLDISKSTPDTSSSSTLSSPSDDLSFSLPSTSPATSAPLSPVMTDSSLEKFPEPSTELSAPTPAGPITSTLVSSIDSLAQTSMPVPGNGAGIPFIGNSLHEIITKLGDVANSTPATPSSILTGTAAERAPDIVETMAAPIKEIVTITGTSTIVESATITDTSTITGTSTIVESATIVETPSTLTHNTTRTPSENIPLSTTQERPETTQSSLLTSTHAPATSSSPCVTVINPLAAASKFVATVIPKDLPLEAPTSKGKPKGKGKAKVNQEVDIMVPGARAINPKNLFAIDYCKTHPTVTIAEFEQVWKDADKETKQRYKVLSAKTKANLEEAKATAMAGSK